MWKCVCASVCELVLVYVTICALICIYACSSMYIPACNCLMTAWKWMLEHMFGHMCISKSLQQRAKDREYKVDDAGYERNSYVFSARSSSVVISSYHCYLEDLSSCRVWVAERNSSAGVAAEELQQGSRCGSYRVGVFAEGESQYGALHATFVYFHCIFPPNDGFWQFRCLSHHGLWIIFPTSHHQRRKILTYLESASS